MGPVRVASGHRRRRPRCLAARASARMRLADARPRCVRGARRAVPGIDDALPPGGAGGARGRGRGDVRPGMDGRPARRPAHGGAGAANARRDDPPAVRRRRGRAAGPRRVHGREGRGERRARRLPAGVPAGGAGGRRGGVHRGLQRPRAAGDDLLLLAGGRRQRTGPGGDRHELGPQRARAGQPGERHHRPSPAARDPERRRRAPGWRRPGDVGQPRQVHVLLRRGRGGLAVGAAVRVAGRDAGGVGGDVVRRGRRAAGRRPAVARRRNRWRRRSPPAFESSPIRSCRSPSTRCWSCRRSTPASSARRAGPVSDCSTS